MSDQAVAEQKEVDLLFGLLAEDTKDKPVSEADKQQIIKSRLTGLINTPFIEGYSLDAQDIVIISMLLDNLLKGAEPLKTIDVLKHLDTDKETISLRIRRLITLKNIGIIQIEARQPDADRQIAVFFRSKLQLSNDFLRKLLGDINAVKPTASPAEPYKDNYEYLSDQFARLHLIENIVNLTERRFEQRRYEPDGLDQYEEELKELESRIAERLAKTEKVFPFEKLKAKKQLSESEALIVLGLLNLEQQNNCQHRHCDPAMVINNLSRNQYEKFLNMKMCRKGGSLDKKGLIEIYSNGSREPDNVIRLKEAIRLSLLGEKRRKEQKRDNFFELIKPSVVPDNVVLDPATSEELTFIIEILQSRTCQRLKEWDIKAYNLIQNSASWKRGKEQAVNMLFYGPPGTGKTLAAHALAHKLGKDILTFDCSRILNMWVGGNEQNTRMIFDRYREIAKRSKNPPVLLLNEADQFLHRRLTDVLRSVDQSYNQMQNIFLEQMEKFEGVLIATTNLVENLDAAFSRRFHHKLEFRRPGVEERLKLWRIHLPEKAPLSEDVDLRRLAESYEFSGGQIAVVVRNAVLKAAIKGNTLCQNDFIDACEKELRGNFDEKAKARIGF